LEHRSTASHKSEGCSSVGVSPAVLSLAPSKKAGETPALQPEKLFLPRRTGLIRCQFDEQNIFLECIAFSFCSSGISS
jgi:hypothetical protein